MKTDDLINLLAIDPFPHPKRPLWQVIASCSGGALLGLTGVYAMGINPHFIDSLTSPSIAIKLFWLSIWAVTGMIGMYRLAHPGQSLGFPGWAWPLAWFILTLLGLSEFLVLASTSPEISTSMFWLGTSWQTCSLAIAGLSLPLLATLFWILRDMAPTQPALEGGVAGLVAGSVTAILYSLHCTETTLGFFALWYGLGILLAGAIGAICGHRWLRW